MQKQRLIWSCGFVYALAVWMCVSTGLLADDTKKTPQTAEAASQEQQTDKDADPLALPDPATKQALLAFLDKLDEMDPEELPEYLQIQQATLKAVNALFEQQDLTDEEALRAADRKFRSLAIQSRFGVKNMEKKFIAFANDLSKDRRPKLAELGRRQLLIHRIRTAAKAPAKEQAALVAEMVKKLQDEGTTVENFPLALGVAEVLEDSTNQKLAGQAYEQFAKLARESQDKRIVDYASRLEGAARRIQLPGNTMKLVGKTIAGEDFDWEKYRGKVVLVDFWASWCAPCRAEFPNVLANYQAYHEKGFDVVGINIDDNREAAQRFLSEVTLPWTTVWNEDHINAEYYGVNSIPQVYLVDAKGKVVSTNARGPELGRLLKEMLGEPVKIKPRAEQPKSDKPNSAAAKPTESGKQPNTADKKAETQSKDPQ